MASRSFALQQAFDHWLAHQRSTGRLRRSASVAVYQAMWQALVAWCRTQKPAPRLADLQGTTLLGYLASRHGMLTADGVLSPRYQQRLVSLVRRVQAHQAWRAQQADAGPGQALALATASPSPTSRQPLLQPVHPGDGPEPPLHLLPDQAGRLQALLADPQDDPRARWQQLRDRCAAALQLGAGLGPGDVRALQLTDLRPGAIDTVPPHRWQLMVPANGSAPAHLVPLADWAAAVLARWLAIRKAQDLGGPWLLPSTRSGKPWGKVAQYEAARRVLADAGLDADGGGSFRLRHTFAMRQLQHGHDAGTVAGWLGVVDPQVMLRYERALPVATSVKPQPEADAQATTASLLWPV
ncbi:MAG TPA: site-specific integrase [Aquabacterium sp.]|nr:site-specific integrase [Aquabacterium sp.]HQC97507.1 site-specific integrase [Aquabacterium sp.]